jgi:hypothetical protein
MSDYEFLRAPWTSKQVDALNRFQRLGHVHEFTCPDPHDGADRTLYATLDGWRCPHCDYRQDWAHPAMLTQEPIESLYILPCDVMLPPATLIRKGCGLDVLMAGMNGRIGRVAEENRFNDPALAAKGLAPVSVMPLHVIGSDYEYDGTLRGIAVKVSGAVRYIIEDDNRRLFIHSAKQIGVSEGWLPGS